MGMTRKRVWITVGAGLVTVALFAWATSMLVGMAVAAPPPLTGDRASDATCEAAVSPWIVDGVPSKATFATMTGPERRDMAREIESAARDASVVEIRDAANRLVSSSTVAGTGLMGQFAFFGQFAALAEACTSHGWDARKAGLVSE